MHNQRQREPDKTRFCHALLWRQFIGEDRDKDRVLSIPVTISVTTSVSKPTQIEDPLIIP